MNIKNITLNLLLLISSGITTAQDVDKSIDYAQTITSEELSKHLHILASDAYEGRETGYKGQKMTEEYLVNYYKSIGIEAHKNTYVQNFEVILRDPEKVDISVQNKSFSFIDDYYYYPPGIQDTILVGKGIYGGYGIDDPKYNDIKGIEFKNQIVIIKNGEPVDKSGKYIITGEKTAGVWSAMREKKVKIFKEKGAMALLIIKTDYEDNLDRLKNYFSHKTMGLVANKEKGKAAMPVFYISEKMAIQLMGKKLFKKGMSKPLKVVGTEIDNEITIAFNRNNNILTSSNVLAYIPGTDKKDELIVVSAHYDHIGIDDEVVYNGADDDGSGTVAVLEMAQAFQLAKEQGYGSRRSLLFLNVSGEEKGLLGSEYYSDHAVFPIENTIANLNIDMIGRVDEAHTNDSMYVYIIGSDMLSQELHNINEQAKEKYSDIKLDYTYNDKEDPNRFYYRSDHYNFAKHNIPVIFYFTGIHEDYHKPTDTVDKIMFGKLEEITRLVFHTAWELANREDRIQLIDEK